jgi:methionine biosynthesis protein MetW
MSQYANSLFEEGSRNNSWANMLQLIPRNSRVIDVGCATGNFGEALEQVHGCTVVGIDIDENDIFHAKKKITEAFVVDINAGYPLDLLGTFDVVIFADVLEHLTEPRGVLRATKALLNAEGVVVYSIPHMGHLSVRFNILEGRFPYTELGLLDRTHLHFYDRYEVTDIFAAAGYTITSENPTLVGYPEVWTAEKLTSLGLAGSPQFYQTLRASDADIFQFIGSAIPTVDVPVILPMVVSEAATPDELLRRMNGLIGDNTRLTLENDRLLQETAEVQSQLAAIRSNPLGVAVRAVVRRVTGK